MSELVKYEYRQEEIEVMNEQRNKQWSLLLFRKYEKDKIEEIAEFSENNSRRWGGGLESI